MRKRYAQVYNAMCGSAATQAVCAGLARIKDEKSTSYEAACCLATGAWKCKSARDAQQRADQEVEEFFESWQGKVPEGERSAMKHALWFAYMGQEGNLSWEEAELLGAAHELSAFESRIRKGEKNPNSDYGTTDARIDMHSNRNGFALGRAQAWGPDSLHKPKVNVFSMIRNQVVESKAGACPGPHCLLVAGD